MLITNFLDHYKFNTLSKFENWSFQLNLKIQIVKQIKHFKSKKTRITISQNEISKVIIFGYTISFIKKKIA